VELDIAFVDVFEVADSFGVFVLSDLFDEDILHWGEFNDAVDIFVNRNVLVLEEPWVVAGELVEGFPEGE
jgi:hypothetical protein